VTHQLPGGSERFYSAHSHLGASGPREPSPYRKRRDWNDRENKEIETKWQASQRRAVSPDEVDGTRPKISNIRRSRANGIPDRRVSQGREELRGNHPYWSQGSAGGTRSQGRLEEE
jgi:hypothetical protein